MKRALGLAILVACAHDPAPRPVAHAKPAPTASATIDDEAFRATPPAIGAAQPFFVPQLVEKRLSNGVRVVSAELDGGGIGLRVVLSGSASFPALSAGKISWLSRSIFGATKTRSGGELRRVLEDAPATWGVSTNADAISISVQTTAKSRVDDCIDVLADVLQNNTLHPETFVFQLPPLAGAARAYADSPAYVSFMTASKLQYGETHPYASSSEAGLENNPKHDPAAMRALFDAIARPDRTTIVAIGAVDAHVLGKIESAFGSWRARPSSIHASPVPAPARKSPMPKIVVVDRPGAPQSYVTIAALGPGHEERDWSTWLMTRAVLGVSATGRIQRALLASGALSGAETTIYPHPGASLFAFVGTVPSARTAEMIAEVHKQIAALRDDGATAAELEASKRSFLRSLPAELETTDGALEVFGTIVEDGLPLDYCTQMESSVRAVSLTDVSNVARDRLAAARLSTVVVGDWKTLAPQLAALGPVELRKP